MKTAALDVDHVMAPTSPPDKAVILVMDDEVALQTLLQCMLEILGYDSVCATEGTAAVALYETARRTGRPFAAVILDVHNRHGMGGTATIATLRAIDPQVKAIVCSANHEDPAMVNYHQHGFLAALPKPFGLPNLHKLLQRLVNGAET